jgi:hypothetical protein
MKASLLPSVFFFSCMCFALGSAAQTAREGAPAGQTGEPAKANTPGDSNIAVENWVKPEPGWLYVLDPKPDAGGLGGRIWIIDPATAKVMGSVRTGENADFALSPDGSRLYVASITEGDSSELAAIDTAQGVVLQRGMIEDREVGDVLPAFSTMAVSGDGLALRILLNTPKSEDRDMFLLATFDTQTGEFLPSEVRLYNCGPGRFISYPAADRFDFLCPRTNRIRLIRVDADSRELQNLDVTLPWERRVGVAAAIEAPGAPDIAIVRGDGTVTKMNVATHEFADTAWHPDVPNRVPPAAWPTSPDGSRVFLGYNNAYDRHYDNRFYLDYGRSPNLRPNDATADEFRVLDTRTWRKIGSIKTKMPFWSAVIGNDGKMLYAMAPQKHSILLIDALKMRQIGVLKIAGTPALALVAP